jgi:2-C-methyl-D-erythritol 2,4-cyclodiphosphate synthase
MIQATRVGIGFDVHRLVRGRPLMLGGLQIESPLGLEGHSDGDVLLHAVTDAMLGACGESDIGDFFPSNDPQWKGAASETFLAKALAKVGKAGLVLNNVDTILIAERPHLGPVGKGEAIEAHAVVLLKPRKKSAAAKAKKKSKRA